MNTVLGSTGVLLATLCLGVPHPSLAVALIDDGEGGATCQHFVDYGRLAWQRPGGDWIDAGGESHGSKPVASVPVPSEAGAAVKLNLTAVVQRWLADESKNNGVLLRYGGRGLLEFHSHESPKPELRPSLELTWADGSHSFLQPRADTFLDCTSHRSLGTLPTLRVSSRQNAILTFDLPAAPPSALVDARLKLTTNRVRGKAQGSIGAFYVVLPAPANGTRKIDGLASRYRLDQGIEKDPAVYFADGFDNDNFRSKWSVFNRKSQVSVVRRDPGDDFQPLSGTALKVTFVPEQNLGLDLRFLFADQPVEAYMRYYLMLGKDWMPVVDGGKLPGFAGTYNKGGWGNRRADGYNGWSARGGFARVPHRNTELFPVGSYVYHAGLKGDSGAFWGWNLSPTGMLQRGRWYAIEQYVRLNTPGSSDGILRAWIDGHPVYERSDLRFRDSDALKIEMAWFNVYHGGTSHPDREMSLYIDNVVIARQYIGPLKQ